MGKREGKVKGKRSMGNTQLEGEWATKKGKAKWEGKGEEREVKGKRKGGCGRACGGK